MTPYWIGVLHGVGLTFAVSLGFILFCLRFAKSHPPIRDEQEETELAETRIYWPPSYNLSTFSGDNE